MNEDLGIGMAADEYMAGRNQFGAQGFVIVNLAIIYDADRACGIPHRLCSADDVSDRETAMAEINRRIPIAVKTLTVRPTMNKRASHRFQVQLVTASNETRNTAHRSGAWEVDGVANAIRTPFSCFEVGADQYLRDQSQKYALNADEER